MAKPQSAEPKAPLIVALAFFVLASLVLGVLFYLETDKRATAVNDAKKAADEKSNAEKLRKDEQDKVRAYRVALGVNTAEEAQELAAAGGKAKEEFDKLRADLQKNLKGMVNRQVSAQLAGQNAGSLAPREEDLINWPGVADGKPPVLSVGEAVVAALAKQLLAASKLTTAEKTLADATKSFQDRSTAADEVKKALEAQIEKVKADYAADIAKRDADLAAIRKQFEAKTNEYTDATNKAQEDIGRQNILLEEAKGKVKSQQAEIDRYTERAEASEDPFRFQKPLGKIVRRERGGNTVYIDLGSADNVPIGLRLTVQPANTPEVGVSGRLRPRLGPSGRPVVENGQPVLDMVPKGRLEVIEVLGPNQSRCRITTESDPYRDRIEYGDLLYNASWRRGKTDAVALYGVFDTNGDGTDDLKSVVGDLQRMNITVAAYFDLDQRKWVDPATGRPTALTEQIVYAIEGQYPAAQQGDAQSDARGVLYNALNDAKQQARDRGIKLVKARAYFPQIGYEYRGADVPPDRVNQAYNRYLRSVAPTDAAPMPEGK
jgi:hypothetical protein